MRPWLNRLSLLALFGSLSLFGCGKKPAESAPPAESKLPVEPIKETPPPARPMGYDRLHQSFAQATRQNPPPDQRPPDRTASGKATGKIYGEVLRLWDTIKFMNLDGTRIHYSA